MAAWRPELYGTYKAYKAYKAYKTYKGQRARCGLWCRSGLVWVYAWVASGVDGEEFAVGVLPLLA